MMRQTLGKDRKRSGIVQRSSRRGSALMLSLLAMAVLSLASITIVHHHRRINTRAMAVLDRAQGRAIASGLIHRHVALARLAGGAPPIQLDPTLSTSRYPQADLLPPVVDPAAQTVTLVVRLVPSAATPAAAITTRYVP